MRYLDSIYGEVGIEESVLLDLMQTRALQRLRGVLQHGITALIGITQPVTRFDHSVGVMLLVRRMGGSLEEEIAALTTFTTGAVASHHPMAAARPPRTCAPSASARASDNA